MGSKFPQNRFTAEQIRLSNIIKDIGFEVILEKECGNYSIDIFCSEVNKGFEYDGIGHSRKRDAKRDQWILDNCGIEIMRVSNLKDPDLREKIKKFIGVT